VNAAARAYGESRRALPVRALEADVFRRVNAALRAAGGEGIALSRALADNRRLWLAVEGALSDPTNALPRPLRAGLVSVGRAVLRETGDERPDLDFLLEVNESIAAGLLASPPAAPG